MTDTKVDTVNCFGPRYFRDTFAEYTQQKPLQLILSKRKLQVIIVG